MSATDLITSFEDFSAKNISYGAPKTNARGGKSIKIQDIRKNTLVIDTPLMLTWGINKMIDEDSGKVSYSLSLQFPSEQYMNASAELFLEKIKAFENKILDDCVKNSKEWFNKPKMSREVAEALYTPTLKYPKDKATGEPDYTRAPSLRIKISYWDGKFNTELYDMDCSPIFNSTTNQDAVFENLVPKTSHVIACVQCNGIWFAGGKFGVTWQLVQAMVRKPVRIQGKCFLRPRNADIQQLQQIEEREMQEEANEEIEAELNTHVDDSDDEESAPVDEPEPEPQPKKTKRRVIRSKA